MKRLLCLILAGCVLAGCTTPSVPIAEDVEGSVSVSSGTSATSAISESTATVSEFERMELIEGYYAVDMGGDGESEWYLYDKDDNKQAGNLVFDDIEEERINDNSISYNAYNDDFIYGFSIFKSGELKGRIFPSDTRKKTPISIQDYKLNVSYRDFQEPNILKEYTILSQKAAELLIDLEKDFNNSINRIPYSGNLFKDWDNGNINLKNMNNIYVLGYDDEYLKILVDVVFDDWEHLRTICFNFIEKDNKWEIESIFDSTVGF